MAYVIGVLIGALLGTLLLTRLTMWLLKRLGDNERRVAISHTVAYAVAVFVGGWGYADGGPPRFLYAAAIYALPILLWVGVDLLALKGRRAKGLAS